MNEHDERLHRLDHRRRQLYDRLRGSEAGGDPQRPGSAPSDGPRPAPEPTRQAAAQPASRSAAAERPLGPPPSAAASLATDPGTAEPPGWGPSPPGRSGQADQPGQPRPVGPSPWAPPAGGPGMGANPGPFGAGSLFSGLFGSPFGMPPTDPASGSPYGSPFGPPLGSPLGSIAGSTGAWPGWGAWQGASGGAAAEKGPLVAIKPDGDKPPFFCIHAVLGSVFPYHRLSLQVEQDRPFYGIQARGLLAGEEPRETIEEMAEAYVAEIRKARPDGPYHLGGYSFGGWVAWEMARRLGDELGVLAVFGVPVPATALWPQLGAQADYLITYARDWQRLVRHSTLAEGYPDWEARLPPSQRVVWANGWAQARWVPTETAVDLDLFLTTEQVAAFADDPTMGWQQLCGGQVRTHKVDGNHLNLFESPQVEALGRQLVERMQQSEAGP